MRRAVVEKLERNRSESPEKPKRHYSKQPCRCHIPTRDSDDSRDVVKRHAAMQSTRTRRKEATRCGGQGRERTRGKEATRCGGQGRERTPRTASWPRHASAGRGGQGFSALVFIAMSCLLRCCDLSVTFLWRPSTPASVTPCTQTPTPALSLSLAPSLAPSLPLASPPQPLPTSLRRAHRLYSLLRPRSAAVVSPRRRRRRRR